MALRARFGIVLLLLSCCSAAPAAAETWYPVSRTLHGPGVPRPGTTLSIAVDGPIGALAADSTLHPRELAVILKELLQRRGYVIHKSRSEWKAALRYRISPREGPDGPLENEPLYSTSFGSAGQEQTALGVRYGAALLQSSLAEMRADRGAKGRPGYAHVLAIVLRDFSGKVGWKGEIKWSSWSGEAGPRVRTAIQLLLADLPARPLPGVRVPLVADSAQADYYRLQCLKQPLSCPALPFEITFERPATDWALSLYFEVATFEFPKSIRNAPALAAYTDLVQTAEFALPLGELGRKGRWDDPFDERPWREVMLGGRYYLGKDRSLANVLLKLEGKRGRYVVKRAWVASDDEFREFERNLSQWKELLQQQHQHFFARPKARISG